MKNLIVFVSKTGTTKECVEKMKKKFISLTDIVDLSKNQINDLKNYNTIVIGSPIYMEKLDKKIVSFCVKNLGQLLQKNVAIFTIGMSSQKDADKHIKNSLPKELIQHAFISNHLGGRLNPGKGSLFIKLAVRAMMKDAGKYSLLEDKIEQFITKINAKDKSDS